MDASDKSFNQLGQNDLTGHQVISSFFSNPVLLLHTLDSFCLTESRRNHLPWLKGLFIAFFGPFPLDRFVLFVYLLFHAFLLLFFIFIFLILICPDHCLITEVLAYVYFLFSFWFIYICLRFKSFLILFCHFVLACLSVSFLFSGVPFIYSFSIFGLLVDCCAALLILIFFYLNTASRSPVFQVRCTTNDW